MILGSSTIMFATGCGERCERIGACTPYSGTLGGGGEGGDGDGGGGGLGGGGQGGDGGGGTIDPGCIPSMLPTGESIPGECGVFVAAGATGAGTKDDPMSDLSAALASVPANKAVYICGTDTFTGTFAVQGGRSIFGGLACGGWTYDAVSRPKLLGVADTPTLTVSGAGDTRLDDLMIENPDAEGQGASSIALLVTGATLDGSRLFLRSGLGATGLPGAAIPPMNPAPDGMPGEAGCNAGAAHLGGSGGQNTCGADTPNGGGGGTGRNSNPGDNGSPGGPLMTGGTAGNGQGVSCTTGGDGAPGSVGSPGAASAELGTFSESGFTPAVTADASPGTFGRGGGGGGGAHQCQSASLAGPGGGGGGAGGCGGAGGHGGSGGGVSVALLVIDAAVTLLDVTLHSGNGGVGGMGGDGQPGQNGGNGGPEGSKNGDLVADACNGGQGGAGGPGGPGAGGNGGLSALIVVQNGSVDRTGATSDDVLGMGGAGGPGSTNAGTVAAAPAGNLGMSCGRLTLPVGTCDP